MLHTSLVGRFDRIRKGVAQCRSAEKNDPIMGCGYWQPEFVEIPFHRPPPGGATPFISFQALVDSKPDVLTFVLCGFGVTGAVAEIEKSWGETRLGALHKLGCSVFYSRTVAILSIESNLAKHWLKQFMRTCTVTLAF